MTTFRDYPLTPTVQQNLDRLGYITPTPIQEASIPLLLQGDDLVAQARTGTGKTAAFGLPLITDTDARGGVQHLVLAPTRELAAQITEELNKLGEGTKFKAYAVFGGVGFGGQNAALTRGRVTCLVACPGRLLDLLERGVADLRDVRTVVLDEADRMLDMGFVRDIDRIFKFLPRNRQTVLASATMPPEVKRLTHKYLYKPEWVHTETDALVTPLADQFQVDGNGDKVRILLTLLAREKPERGVIFTRTKHGAKRLAKKIARAGYKADALQGNLSQNARDRVMKSFRDGSIDYLVATDVAARGLDVKDVTHVIQFDVPNVAEDYVHRTGRTARAGKEGRAFILVARDDAQPFRAIERITGVPIRTFDVGPLVAAPEPEPQGPRGAPRQGGGQRNGGGQRHMRPRRSHNDGGRSGGRPGGRPGQRQGQGGGQGQRRGPRRARA